MQSKSKNNGRRDRSEHEVMSDTPTENGKDPLRCALYHPLPLFNSDYKILSKVLAPWIYSYEYIITHSL